MQDPIRDEPIEMVRTGELIEKVAPGLCAQPSGQSRRAPRLGATIDTGGRDAKAQTVVVGKKREHVERGSIGGLAGVGRREFVALRLACPRGALHRAGHKRNTQQQQA